MSTTMTAKTSASAHCRIGPFASSVREAVRRDRSRAVEDAGDESGKTKEAVDEGGGSGRRGGRTRSGSRRTGTGQRSGRGRLRRGGGERGWVDDSVSARVVSSTGRRCGVVAETEMGVWKNERPSKPVRYHCSASAS